MKGFISRAKAGLFILSFLTLGAFQTNAYRTNVANYAISDDSYYFYYYAQDPYAKDPSDRKTVYISDVIHYCFTDFRKDKEDFRLKAEIAFKKFLNEKFPNHIFICQLGFTRPGSLNLTRESTSTEMDRVIRMWQEDDSKVIKTSFTYSCK